MSKFSWNLDPAHTLVEFSVKHMIVATVKGRFGQVSGKLEADPADLTTAQITAEIDAASIDTRMPDRDNHLRSADFFDVENHPTITFASKHVMSKGGAAYTVVGDLTIHGVTKEISLELHVAGTGKDPWGQEMLALSLSGVVNRKEFGLNWNVALEAGGVLVSEQVKLEIHVEAIKEAAVAA